MTELVFSQFNPLGELLFSLCFSVKDKVRDDLLIQRLWAELDRSLFWTPFLDSERN